MKPYMKLLLFGVGVLCIAAAGNQYFQVLPGLQIKHPITGATTATINGTNGTVTAGYFVGDGSGLTGLPSGGSSPWTNVSGVIKPASVQTTNVLAFTSGLADNATNVAMVVDTAAPWTGPGSGAQIATFGSGGIPKLRIRSDGSMFAGAYCIDDIPLSQTTGYFPYAVSMVTSNEPSKVVIALDIGDSESWNYEAQTRMYGEGSETMPQANISCLTYSTNGLVFSSTISSGQTSWDVGGNVASSTRRIEFTTGPTNIFYVDYDGSVTSAGTVSSVGFSIGGVAGFTGFTTNGLGGFVTNKLYWSGGIVTNVTVISF